MLRINKITIIKNKKVNKSKTAELFVILSLMMVAIIPLSHAVVSVQDWRVDVFGNTQFNAREITSLAYHKNKDGTHDLLVGMRYLNFNQLSSEYDVSGFGVHYLDRNTGAVNWTTDIPYSGYDIASLEGTNDIDGDGRRDVKVTSNSNWGAYTFFIESQSGEVVKSGYLNYPVPVTATVDLPPVDMDCDGYTNIHTVRNWTVYNFELKPEIEKPSLVCPDPTSTLSLNDDGSATFYASQSDDHIDTMIFAGTGTAWWGAEDTFWNLGGVTGTKLTLNNVKEDGSIIYVTVVGWTSSAHFYMETHEFRTMRRLSTN